MYQHVTDTRPDQEPLRIDVEQLMNALRRIMEMTETCKKSWIDAIFLLVTTIQFIYSHCLLDYNSRFTKEKPVKKLYPIRFHINTYIRM